MIDAAERLRGREARYFAALFVVCLSLHAYLATVGWDHNLSDHHEFRQTQTAISTYYLVRDGFRLDYETPVLGAPWAVPFEFPLYQWMVAGLVLLSGLPLESAGRLVSLVCFYSTLVPAYALLGRFVPAKRHRLIFLALLLASPSYIFWSRTFMIESLALLLSVGFLALIARAGPQPSLGVSAITILVGTLAALTKITTLVVFCPLAVTLIVLDQIRARSDARSRRWRAERLLASLMVVGIPLAAAAGWTRYADSVKLQNPLAAFSLSSELSSWTVGTLAQRLTPDTWVQVYLNSVPVLIGSGAILLVCAALAILVRGRRWEAGLSVCFFLVGPFIFTNLYYVHDYYSYANGIFLLAAIGFVLVGLCEAVRLRSMTRLMIIPSLVSLMYVTDVRSFAMLQRANFDDLQRFAHIVRSWAPNQDDVLLIYGLDWNPALPYYAERRALMDRDALGLDDSRFERALVQLGSGGVAAMVIGPNLKPSAAFVQDRVVRFGFIPEPVVQTAEGDLYVRARVAK